MHYIYEYELSAFVIIGALLLYIRSQHLVSTRPMRRFMYFLYAAFAESGLNVASCIAIDASVSVPRLLIDGIKLTFYVVEALCLVCFFFYMCSVCGLRKKTNRGIYLLGVIPAAADLLFILSNPWTHALYELNSHNVYALGPYASVEFVSFAYYLLLTFAVAFYYRHRLQVKHIFIIAEYTLLSSVAITAEYFIRPLLLTGAVNALVLLNIYVSLQNPRLYQEAVTGLGNWRALSLRVNQYIRRKEPFVVICLDLNANRSLFQVMEYTALIHLEETIGSWLTHETPKATQIFYLAVQRCFFLIITPEQISKVTKQLSERFTRPWPVQGSPVTLTVNLFVESYPENFLTFEGLSGIIHSLRLDNKRSGGVILMPDNPSQHLYRRSLHIRKVLEKAIDERTLEMYYQPIVATATGRPRMLEALARLKDTDGSYIPPDQFITIAEQTGLIYSLQQLVLEKVCEFCRDSLSKISKHCIESVHINLSVLECMQPNMASRIIETIERYGLPPAVISLELTERMALVTSELMQKHISLLRERGILFSLDDYGTGNANISYLISYDFDTIKFDRHLMQSFFKQEKAHRIIEREFSTIQDLGLMVVAEGIETEDEVKTLKKHGIPYIQGYFYSRPLPPKECLEYLEKNA